MIFLRYFFSALSYEYKSITIRKSFLNCIRNIKNFLWSNKKISKKFPGLHEKSDKIVKIFDFFSSSPWQLCRVHSSTRFLCRSLSVQLSLAANKNQKKIFFSKFFWKFLKIFFFKFFPLDQKSFFMIRKQFNKLYQEPFTDFQYLHAERKPKFFWKIFENFSKNFLKFVFPLDQKIFFMIR